MPKFRKLPVTIEAIQFTGSNWGDVLDWASANGADGVGVHSAVPPETPYLTIHTLEGDMRADVGDWIIRGVKGELYPCKPDIFAATYEKVVE